MNTGQRNSQGRVIFRGPRGGEYVLGAGGRKIRSFTRATAAAPAAAPSALNAAKAHMNTLTTITARKAYLRSRAANLSNANWRALGEYKNTLNYRARAARAARAAPAAATVNRNTLGRVIHRGPRGGEYVVGPGGRKIRTFTRATAPAAPAPTAAETRAAEALARRLSSYLKLGNNEYVNKYGFLYNSQAKMKTGLAHRVYNNARVRAFNKDPKFLTKHAIPYISYGRPNQAFKSKLKLKNANVEQMGRTYNGINTGVSKQVYFNKKGELYYISLNGKKHKVDDFMTQSQFAVRNSKLRNLKRLVGRLVPNYPRSAIPPNTPAPRRSSPELMNNMITQIFEGGRGSTINAGRYTAAERNVLANRLANTVAHFRQLRNVKKAEAAQRRANLRAPGLSNNMKRIYRNRAAAANERVGYYNNAVRSYTRGLRAVKPLSGVVTPRARAMPNTPNRYTPAPANVEENAIYMPLNRPHLVVKTPGVGTIYLNPNTFRGLVKNAARVNIAPANIRNWLRMARRNFPNEALFRHPLAPKNVTASHIRFSRA